jgi:hypothetical protein
MANAPSRQLLKKFAAKREALEVDKLFRAWSSWRGATCT